MANNAGNVVVGVTGSVYVGPTTATAPTSSTATLTGFTDLGYVSSDGVTFTTDKSTTQIRAWQNADLVRESITEGTVTYAFTLLETTENAIEAYFGGTLTDGKIEVNPVNTGGRKSFVIDVIDGAKAIRHYIPTGEILSVEAQQIQNGEAVGYGLTVTAYASAGRVADVFYSEFEA
jgi:Ethanolamine utilization protein EutJ (predicted chaperonin)